MRLARPSPLLEKVVECQQSEDRAVRAFRRLGWGDGGERPAAAPLRRAPDHLCCGQVALLNSSVTK